MEDLKILKLFAEPVFKYKLENYEDFNKELEKYIYQLKKEDLNKNITLSNRGGWHSPNFKLTQTGTIQHKFALAMQKYILRTCLELGWVTENKHIRINNMWSIINKKNDFNVIHTHPNSFLSTAYYVRAPKDCGEFQVESLNIAKKYSHPEIKKVNELNRDRVGINVEEGDLLIFPGYLPHKVSKNQSDKDRIVISFNVDIK